MDGRSLVGCPRFALIRSRFELSNSDDGVITVDGDDFGKAFSEAAGDADRAFSELMDPSERIIGYLSALRWFAFTGDDEGQISEGVDGWRPI